jgi:hypothetical protein
MGSFGTNTLRPATVTLKVNEENEVLLFAVDSTTQKNVFISTAYLVLGVISADNTIERMYQNIDRWLKIIGYEANNQ